MCKVFFNFNFLKYYLYKFLLFAYVIGHASLSFIIAKVYREEKCKFMNIKKKPYNSNR